MDERTMFDRGRRGLELALLIDHERPEVRAFVAGMVFAAGPRRTSEALEGAGAAELVRELAVAAAEGRGEVAPADGPPELELTPEELLREHRGY